MLNIIPLITEDTKKIKLPGRPKNEDDSKNKKIMVSTYLSETEHQALIDLLNTTQTPKSTFIRSLILKEL